MSTLAELRKEIAELKFQIAMDEAKEESARKRGGGKASAPEVAEPADLEVSVERIEPTEAEIENLVRQDEQVIEAMSANQGVRVADDQDRG